MIRNLVLSGLLLTASTASLAAERVVPPDPVADPLLIHRRLPQPPSGHQIPPARARGVQETDFEKALRYFRRSSFFADKPSQGMVAEMYWKGEGTPRDPVQAYVWMDLAAERGYRGFIGLREQ